MQEDAFSYGSYFLGKNYPFFSKWKTQQFFPSTTHDKVASQHLMQSICFLDFPFTTLE